MGMIRVPGPNNARLPIADYEKLSAISHSDFGLRIAGKGIHHSRHAALRHPETMKMDSRRRILSNKPAEGGGRISVAPLSPHHSLVRTPLKRPSPERILRAEARTWEPAEKPVQAVERRRSIATGVSP